MWCGNDFSGRSGWIEIIFGVGGGGVLRIDYFGGVVR